MRLKTSYALVGVAAMAAVGYVAVERWPSSSGSVQLKPHLEATDATLIPSASNVYTPKAVLTPVLSQLGLAKPRPAKAETKAEAFDRLANSPDAANKYAAYKLASKCTLEHVLAEPARTPWFGINRQAVHDVGGCDDLKPGQWDDAAKRIELLRPATLRGDHGAWWALHGNEGPRGIYRTIPDSPEFRAWEEQAYQAALKNADPFALARESQEWLDKDLAKALVLTVAYRESLTRDTPSARAPFDPKTDPEVSSLAARLDPKVASQAIAAGRQLVAAATQGVPR